MNENDNLTLPTNEETEQFFFYLSSLITSFSRVMMDIKKNQHLSFEEYAKAIKKSMSIMVELDKINNHQEERVSLYINKDYFVEQVKKHLGYKLGGDAVDIALNMLALMEIYHRNRAMDMIQAAMRGQ